MEMEARQMAMGIRWLSVEGTGREEKIVVMKRQMQMVMTVEERDVGGEGAYGG